MNPNDLLLWLSAKRDGTWARFRAAIDELQVGDEDGGDDEDLGEAGSEAGSLPIHHRLRLNFERLGHAEFFRRDFESGWRVAPPTLAGIENGERPSGILCGARTDQIVEKIRTSCRTRVTSQSECPDRIEVFAETDAELERIAEAAGLLLAPRAARTLLSALPPIDNWQLRSLTELPFGNDWEVYRFSSESLRWSAAPPDDARSCSFGLFRFQVAHQPQYFICRGRKVYKVPVQVGKYLVLKRSRRHVVDYDSGDKVLSVPVSCRPPLLVDRALTLCSGLIPSISCGRLVYSNIYRSTATAVARLLRQA